MKSLITIGFLLISLASNLVGQCIDEKWHNTSFESNWLSCASQQNPLPELGNSHWILYQFDEAKAIESINIWNISNPSLVEAGIKVLRIDYSPDGATWENLGLFDLEMGSGSKNNVGQLIEDFETINAAYVLFTALSTYGNACAGLAEVQFNIGEVTTPTQDVTLKEKLQIRPNPADTEIKVNLKGLQLENLNVGIYNVMGQRVYYDDLKDKGQILSYSIDVSLFPEGQYFLKVFNNEKFATEKITVIHPR